MRNFYSAENIDSDMNVSLLPPDFLYYTGEPEECFNKKNRRWQSAATIAKAKNGRLFCAYNAGGIDEGPNNYIAMSYSDDDGYSWRNDYLIIDHPRCVRMHEPILWVDPNGLLWFFWAQSYVYWDSRGGLWASVCADPGANEPHWSEPRRLADGVMACKPIVRQDGAWLFPVSIWHNFPTRFNRLEDKENSSVYVSFDNGRTLSFLGFSKDPLSTFDENILCGRSDGSLLMLIRSDKGITYSESTDGGVTWTLTQKYCLPSPSARMYVGKFPSGNVFFVHNYTPGAEKPQRTDMTALLSHDEGRSYRETLLLDSRYPVAYPDGFVDADGKAYVVYDRERYGDKEIHLAVFREEDIVAGRCVTEGARLGVIVCKAYGAVRTEKEKECTLWPREFCKPLNFDMSPVKQYYRSFDKASKKSVKD